MAVLSHGENKGLEPFIEKLTDGQKADISTKLEIYHNTGRLKGRASKAARARFAKSSDAESQGEGLVVNPLTPMPVKIQRMESLATSSKPLRLRGKRLRVSTPPMAKRVRANEPSPSRERDRGRNLEPNLRKRVLRLVRARVRSPRPNLPSL